MRVASPGSLALDCLLQSVGPSALKGLSGLLVIEHECSKPKILCSAHSTKEGGGGKEEANEEPRGH